MTQDAFVQAVQGMVGLRPDMISHLVALAPKLSAKRRDTVIAELAPMHEQILQAGKAVVDEIDAGEKQIKTYKKNAREKQEASERINADAILTDDSSMPSPL